MAHAHGAKLCQPVQGIYHGRRTDACRSAAQPVQRGELRQRYREGQEDQLGALGLVVNALVLWNTRYMDAALSHLRSQGAEVKPEDVARLSPLADKHFNVLGRYHFTVNDSILRGDLRPLRDPDAPEELVWAAGA